MDAIKIQNKLKDLDGKLRAIQMRIENVIASPYKTEDELLTLPEELKLALEDKLAFMDKKFQEV